MKEKFNWPFKGGHRSHLWIRKNKSDKSADENNFKNIPLIPTDEFSKGLPGIIANEIDITYVGDSVGGYQETTQGQIHSTSSPIKSKLVKIVSTARGGGGCARSVTTLMRILLKAGHRVEFIPFRNAVGSSEFNQALKGDLRAVKVNLNYEAIQEPGDTLLVYADDYVWEFVKPEFENIFSTSGIKAQQRIMMLNYRRGKVGEVEWTKNWDKYMFLNSAQEAELLKVHPGVKTKVLPPCTDLESFFNVKVDYTNGLRIVRHSSQGDTKFSKDVGVEITQALLRPDVTISMLPGPSFVPVTSRFKKVPRTADPQVIANFLANGNLFWYSLPMGYQDMGPRVILEAMAAGLPVIADPWGGAPDRVVHCLSGFIGSKEEQMQFIHSVDSAKLARMGKSARARAKEHFSKEAWIEELVGDQ